MLRRHSSPLLAGIVGMAAIGCSRQPPAPEAAPPPSHEARPSEPSARSAPPDALVDAASESVAATPVDAGAIADDPMATHFMLQPDLIHLISLAPPGDARAAAHRDALLAYLIAPTPGHFNDGNRALAHHAISRAKCLAGLGDEPIQTDDQRAACKGEKYMVPVYSNGDPHSAKVCVDQFEFPNQPCELPFVWGTPSEAETVCRIEGKRLCTQQEWSLACSADPAGKTKQSYAYGDKLDMAICNTSIPHEAGPDGKAWRCYVRDATTTWNTCSTDTEPAGAFPRCKSRLGVFDQHGNVAEMMTRAEDGEVFTQLKGSAFFYVDVAREPGKAALHPERESYPDTCWYDPRWHVEKLTESLHSNYHLGFRCCKEL